MKADYAIITEERGQVAQYDAQLNLIELTYLQPPQAAAAEMELESYCDLTLDLTNNLGRAFNPLGIALTTTFTLFSTYEIINWSQVATEEIESMGLSSTQALAFGMGIVIIYSLLLWIAAIKHARNFGRFLVHTVITLILSVSGIYRIISDLSLFASWPVWGRALFVAFVMQFVINLISFKISQALVCNSFQPLDFRHLND